MSDAFRALQAQVGTQFGDLIAKSKRAAVLTGLAGAVAIGGMGAAQAQEAPHTPTTAEKAGGAALGAIGGQIVGKIFGASPSTRNIISGVGGVIGWNSMGASQDAGGKLALSEERAQHMNVLASQAMATRALHREAYLKFNDLELDKRLSMGQTVEFKEKHRLATYAYLKSKNADEMSSGAFVNDYRILKDKGYNVSSYAVYFEKLRYPMRSSDSSYVGLAMEASKVANLKTDVDPGVSPAVPSDDLQKPAGLSL